MTYKEDVSEDDNARYLNLLFTKLRSKSETHKSEEVIFEDTYWTYKGNMLGWIDIRSINTDITKYSLYIAKYLTKDNNVVAKDKHIYGYSRNLKRPRKIAYLTKCTLEEILDHLKDYNPTTI